MAPDPEVPGYTPSGLVNANKKAAHEMTAEDVEMLIDCFVGDIVKIKDLGFDGVELHGAHGYLIDNFSGKALIKELTALAVLLINEQHLHVKL